jgi:hypothetical protein
MQHRISSTTTVTLGVNPKKAAALLVLLTKKEEVTQAQQKLVALQCTPHSEERDKAIADLKLQIAILKEEEAECHQLFKNSLKP